MCSSPSSASGGRIISSRSARQAGAGRPARRAEGYRPAQIHLAGNVMVDPLLANLDRALASDVLSRLGLSRGGYALVTLHRPANVDDPGALATLLSALDEVA